MGYSIEVSYEAMDQFTLQRDIESLNDYIRGIYDSYDAEDSLQNIRFACAAVLNIMQYPNTYEAAECVREDFENRRQLFDYVILKMSEVADKFNDKRITAVLDFTIDCIRTSVFAL